MDVVIIDWVAVINLAPICCAVAAEGIVELEARHVAATVRVSSVSVAAAAAVGVAVRSLLLVGLAWHFGHTQVLVLVSIYELIGGEVARDKVDVLQREACEPNGVQEVPEELQENVSFL